MSGFPAALLQHAPEDTTNSAVGRIPIFLLKILLHLKKEEAASPVMAFGWQCWAVNCAWRRRRYLLVYWFLVAHNESSSLLCSYLQLKKLLWMWLLLTRDIYPIFLNQIGQITWQVLHVFTCAWEWNVPPLGFCPCWISFGCWWPRSSFPGCCFLVSVGCVEQPRFLRVGWRWSHVGHGPLWWPATSSW